jgi:hypothetical protein
MKWQLQGDIGMTDLSLEQCFARSDGYVTRAIAEETLIVPTSQQVANLNSIYTLNDVASKIWSSLNGQMSLCQIIEIIAFEYDVSTETATGDVVDFVTELANAGLIRPVNK